MPTDSCSKRSLPAARFRVRFGPLHVGQSGAAARPRGITLQPSGREPMVAVRTSGTSDALPDGAIRACVGDRGARGSLAPRELAWRGSRASAPSGARASTSSPTLWCRPSRRGPAGGSEVRRRHVGCSAEPCNQRLRIVAPARSANRPDAQLSAATRVVRRRPTYVTRRPGRRPTAPHHPR